MEEGYWLAQVGVGLPCERRHRGQCAGSFRGSASPVGRRGHLLSGERKLDGEGPRMPDQRVWIWFPKQEGATKGF